METQEQYITSATPVLAVETDLAPVALDLIVKWSEADEARRDAESSEQHVSAYSWLHTIEQSMRGLANQIEGQRLAASMERDQALPFEPPRSRQKLFKTE